MTEYYYDLSESVLREKLEELIDLVLTNGFYQHKQISNYSTGERFIVGDRVMEILGADNKLKGRSFGIRADMEDYTYMYSYCDTYDKYSDVTLNISYRCYEPLDNSKKIYKNDKKRGKKIKNIFFIKIYINISYIDRATSKYSLDIIINIADYGKNFEINEIIYSKAFNITNDKNTKPVDIIVNDIVKFGVINGEIKPTKQYKSARK